MVKMWKACYDDVGVLRIEVEMNIAFFRVECPERWGRLLCASGGRRRDEEEKEVGDVVKKTQPKKEKSQAPAPKKVIA